MTSRRVLWELAPELASVVIPERLGQFPTPVESMSRLTAEMGLAAAPLFAKRDDLSSPIYGGNKVRTLEVLLALARAQGAQRVYSTGAYGSNHALAATLHAARIGLSSGALLFPQPVSCTAAENLHALLVAGADVRPLQHWTSLPWAMHRLRAQQGDGAFVMPPGGATAVGALGYVNAALELGEQIQGGELSPPGTVVVAVGSTCTTAGLLVGLWHSVRIGLGFDRMPRVMSVRVTPWPVTSRVRILGLALECGRLLSATCGWPAPTRAELSVALDPRQRYLGWGYGRPTRSGAAAQQRWQRCGGHPLDSTYSAKSAAAAIDAVMEQRHPVLFWSTKSSASLSAWLDRALPADVPQRLREFVAQGRDSA